MSALENDKDREHSIEPVVRSVNARDPDAGDTRTFVVTGRPARLRSLSMALRAQFTVRH
jgi:hypothetical protein